MKNRKANSKPSPSKVWFDAIRFDMGEVNNRGGDVTYAAQDVLETVEEYLNGERDLPLDSRLTRAEFERLVVRVAYECIEWTEDVDCAYTVLIERFGVSLNAREAVDFERASEWYRGINDEMLA